MKEDGALFDSGFDDTGPFRVTPESGGVSLESALRDFGPAAIDDLIPRLRALAASLDAAHRAARVHGALHPSKVFVYDDATLLIAGTGAHAPYAAPEVIDGHGATPLSDQFSLAAIAYEWLFGRPIAYNSERPIEFRSMPGVDRVALSKAFTRALSPRPEDRFTSCGAFGDALNGAIVPELPLLADVDDFSAEDELQPPIIPLEPFDSERDHAFLAQDKPNVDDALLDQGRQADVDIIDPRLSGPEDEPEPAPVAVPSWSPAVAAPTPSPRTMEPQRFGPVALFLAVIVGAVFGFAAGYMARPRALQSGPAQEIAVAPPAGESGDTRDASEPREKPKSSPVSPVSPASPASPAKLGRLLVRSTPSGASVSVDGVARGVTPLALRNLDVGTRNVSIARRGYISETRRVLITKARPSRTLDVSLSAEARGSASAAAGRSGETSPELARPRASVGGLSVDSRPSGATVTINGTARGTTPLAIDDLAPGEYRIRLAMPGYRNFATTVRVVAGERVRAAASLTALEQ